MGALQGTSLSVLDLRKTLQSAALNAQVYHRTDTHWNAVGALLASSEILSTIKKDFPVPTLPSLNDYRQDSVPFSGDLAGFLPPDPRFIEMAPDLVPAFQSKSALEEGADKTIISSIPASALPRALIFRDSFADALIPFLSEHFSRMVLVHSFSVDLNLAVQEKPDLVIYEIAQRYLTVLR
jgi:alginate O-acetyltransferase complex protein AlgJ